MFIDEATLAVRGGDGGNGCRSFRREKFVPRGGPDGGDGGHGGSVVLVANCSTTTLLQFRRRSMLRGERGRHGQGSSMTGRSGADLTLRVPVGTIVLDEHGTRVLADLSTEGQTFVAAAGGRGGRGNSRFASSVQRAPTRTERGFPGEERLLRLELKLLADVGLLGFPNAGKSTLISRVSSARPKVASYPFTTLEPHLGVVDRGDFRSFVMADIPGLIEGSHRGAGLGQRFLRHIERCRLLLHLVDVTDPSRDPVEGIRILDSELRRYRADLATRPQILVITKADAIQDAVPVARVREFAAESNRKVLRVSSVSGLGVHELIHDVSDALDRLPAVTPTAHDVQERTAGEALGVMGGTFDPVHLGHLCIAERILRVIGLARVLMLPCAAPPHKSTERLAPARDREAMLRLALADRPGLQLSTLEMDGSRVSFTIDTLRKLRDEHGFEPLFILGMDSLQQIETWHEYRQLLDEFDLVVVDRPGRGLHQVRQHLAAPLLDRILHVEAAESGGLSVLRPGSGGRIFHVGVEPIPISSSEIRRKVRDGEGLGGLVPDSVAEYIQRTGLYRQEETR